MPQEFGHGPEVYARHDEARGERVPEIVPAKVGLSLCPAHIMSATRCIAQTKIERAELGARPENDSWLRRADLNGLPSRRERLGQKTYLVCLVSLPKVRGPVSGFYLYPILYPKTEAWIVD